MFPSLSSRESHLVSLYNAPIETSLVAPVATLAAQIKEELERKHLIFFQVPVFRIASNYPK